MAHLDAEADTESDSGQKFVVRNLAIGHINDYSPSVHMKPDTDSESSIESGSGKKILMQNLTIGHISGGVGGMGGAGGYEGGMGGTGQGPRLTIYAKAAIFGRDAPIPGNIFTESDDTDDLVDVSCPPPTKYFQGRQDTFLQLQSVFGDTSQKEQIVVLLHGLGGVGKTQMALKFIAESSER
uniref:NB-ARC domain-containing protein n=1 Tax=Mycena chlorophos TaxID=658473 RepID=A0ABQ0LGA7_MYCCL|nr:predicted protein [Mycena chlorophos]